MPRVRRDDWDALTPFERNCAFWAESQRLLREGLAHHPRVLRLRLDELLAGGEVVERLLEFLELRRPPEAALSTLLATRVNGRREIKARVAQHRSDVLPQRSEWPDALNEQFRRLCGAEAAALGFAP
jgi:hypothetical protein